MKASAERNLNNNGHPDAALHGQVHRYEPEYQLQAATANGRVKQHH